MRACEPQHSASLVHVSPSTWQPVAGWQMATPVGPQGAHRRLQQEPPHPPSVNEAGVQSMPSTIVQLPPVVGAAHTPTLWPLARVQAPLQQSAFFEQMSLVCAQKDDGWQAPRLHRLEQQSAFVPQPLPSVPQAPPLSEAHVPLLPQLWLQH